MKKKLILLIILVGLSIYLRKTNLISFVDTNRTVSVDKKPVKLIDEFYSFSTYKKVKEELKSKGLVDQITESSLAEGDKRPKFNFLTVTIESYNLFGSKGTLKLSFFNNKLFHVVFVPINYLSFFNQLKLEYSSEKFMEGEVNIRRGNLEIKSYINTKEEKAVRWNDIRLSKEAEEWITKFS